MCDYYPGSRDTRIETYTVDLQYAVLGAEQKFLRLKEASTTDQPESTKPIVAQFVEDTVEMSDGNLDLVYAALDYFDEVVADVNLEINAAIDKHTLENTPLNPDKDIRDSFIILSEEVGEVARALTYDEGDIDKLYAELIQVAAMAAAMAAGLLWKVSGNA